MVSSLLLLPVELVYRILDNFDKLTILFSCRNICSRLNIIIDTYHRYQTLGILDLERNNIDAQKAQKLVNALQYNTTVTTLKLNTNNIDSQGAQYIANGLQNDHVIQS
ncbi:unnamed protein product [Rotaria sordida]|uniref:F-box domain-containing protein n=1 Tax=Rotaria sordida TaxID=392033 RepID=A0A814GLY2_9BILA|nr:unnamed protein product [Rotaria sordida]